MKCRVYEPAEGTWRSISSPTGQASSRGGGLPVGCSRFGRALATWLLVWKGPLLAE